MGLVAKIWAWRLGGGVVEEKEKEKEKIGKYRASTPLGPLPCSPLNFQHNLQLGRAPVPLTI